MVEERPSACIAETLATEVGRRVGRREREIGIFSVEIAFLARKLDDVFGIHHILFVFQVKLVDATLVGVRTDAIVGDANRHPNGTFFLIAFANHLHNPHLVRVGNGERFAFRRITIASHEIGHHLNGFASRLGALQTECHQRHVVYATHRIFGS